MFGTDRNCDIVLPGGGGISHRHCYLTFDAGRRLILRDCSTYGTIVEYDNKGGELRRHFTWILGGHDFPLKVYNIVIRIRGINLRIVVSNHDTNLVLYNANIDKFLLQAGEPSFNAPGIYTPTAPPSQPRTPSQAAIRLKQEKLGAGSFAVVRRVWDVSTGFSYAY